jgi:hypothetical protein
MANEINFTPLGIGDAATHSNLNSRLAQLDTAIKRNTWAASSAPTTGDDELDLYSAGSRWYDSTNHRLYICEDATAGAAVWRQVAGPGAGNVDVTGTAGEALSERSFVYLDTSSNTWFKMDTDASPIRCGAVRGLVAQPGGISNGSSGTIRLAGELDGFSSLTAGGAIYASSTAGGYTQTRPNPSAGGGQVAIIQWGYARSTTVAAITPHRVEYVKRESLANNGTATILHHADAAARRRVVHANIATTSAGSAEAEWGSANQDTTLALRGPDFTEASTDINVSGSSGSPVGDISGTEYRMAQSFQCPAGTLYKIKFTLVVNTGSPSGGLSWEIRTNNAGVPSSTVLASGGPVAVTASAENTITVAGGPSLSASTTYWLVLYTGAQSNDNYYEWKAETPSVYANGQRAYSTNSGSSWTADAYDHECEIVVAVAADDLDKLAQSFQIGSTATIDKAQLHLKKTGSPGGTMTLRIETDNSGEPSGTLADANATIGVAESGLSTSLAMVDFDFSTNFSLSGSTTYWLVLSTDRTQSDTNYVEWGADAGGGYSSGESGSQVSSTWTTPNASAADLVFAVVGASTT